MEAKFSKLRRELDSLGYFQILSSDSIPLVYKLLDDLKTTSINLQKYIKIAQIATKEKEDLELGLGPRKLENEKLLREYNDLHITYSNYRIQKEREIKELRSKVLLLNEENSKLDLDNEKLRTSLRETELDLMKSGKKTQGSKSGSKSKNHTDNALNEDLLRENIEIKYEFHQLKKELKNLQCKCRQLELFSELSSPEENWGAERLKLSGGHTVKDLEDKIHSLHDEIHILRREKNELELSYKEALSKQHEAMKRAIHLAERNKELEKELKDIDRMAIAVEEECNDAVKSKNHKLTKTEASLKEALEEIQSLERTITGMKKDKQELELTNEILTEEKKRAHNILEAAVKEKLDAIQELNNLKVIEKDLNLEINRLVQENSSQKHTIAELEGKIFMLEATKPGRGPGGDVVTVQLASTTSKTVAPPPADGAAPPADGAAPPADGAAPPTGPRSPPDISKQGSLSDHAKKLVATCDCGVGAHKCCMEKETLTEAFRSGCLAQMCLMHFQELMRKELEKCQCELKEALKKVTQERNHYIEEFHKLAHELCQLKAHDCKCSKKDCCPVCPKTQQIVEFLQRENKTLSQEKMVLAARLEETRNDTDILGKCNKSSCKRIQRERDLFKADVGRLEQECDCLRDNMKLICEAKTREHDTFAKQIQEYERRIRKMESERGELMNAQGTRRAQVDTLGERNEMMKQVLRTAQDDLQNQRILYSQLKTLHDQTDRALHDSQAQLTQVERELAQAYATIQQLKKSSSQSKGKFSEVELDTMKRQLNKMDQEKDDLLNIVDSKTEEIASLREDLDSKHEIIERLKGEISGLRSQLGNETDRASSSTANLKFTEAELSRLQRELDTAIKTRDRALEVNRKLQDELAAVSREANLFKNQLAKSQDQIDNLKLQSQQYISEVKRAEDLIEAKEKEREDLLNQFKQLSLETNHLQSSNSALESEANQSRVQLSVAMDHVHDLEQRGETLETLINDYEKQIGLLTNQIAKFESERTQHMRYQDRTEAEIKSLRELCMKLDKDKEQLRMQLLNKDRDGDRLTDLRQENEMLTERLADCRKKLAATEKLLKDSRHEGVEMKLKDEEAYNEISLLKGRIDDLETRLAKALQDVDMYQEKAIEYSNQIKQLRRQITDERYDKASRGEDDRFPRSHKDCPEKCVGGEICGNQCLRENQDQIEEPTIIPPNTEESTPSDNTPSPTSLPYYDSSEESASPGGSPVDGSGSIKLIVSLDGAVSSRLIGSKKFLDDKAQVKMLKKSLTAALKGSGKYCNRNSCYPGCKSYDPLNKICGKHNSERRTVRMIKSMNYNKKSANVVCDSKDGKTPCNRDTCRYYSESR